MPETRPAWPEGATSQTIISQGLPIRLTTLGEGEDVVVCLHGLGGSALNFGIIAPLLAAERRVLLPDLLGHGRSGSPAPAVGAVEAQLSMIDDVIMQEGTGRPVVLIGHSMGGILAQLHALRAPQQVSRLVLLDPPVPNLTRFRRDPRLTAKLILLRSPGVGALVARKLAGMTPEELVDQQLADATPHPDRIPRVAIEAAVAETRERAAAGIAEDGQRAQWEAILEIVALLARPTAWRERLAAITAPTLWLQGEDDPLADATAAAALAASRPDWTFRTRAGVGHLPQLEDPVWTVDTIEAWLHSDHQ
jgi:pimeloyl-ACP methyl ester carboxylesterase